MKKNILVLTTLTVVLTCFSAFKSAPTEGDALVFKALEYNFGKVAKGLPVSHTFEFNNEAAEAITITKATASCGCTVTDYSREVIEPGKTGFVKATYSAASPGAFSKTVSVYHNGSETPIVLTIKGEVTE